MRWTRRHFPNPQELPLQNIYDFTLSYADFMNPNGPDAGVPSLFRLLCYNGQRVGPTIRVRRGSTLRIHLKNGLEKNTPDAPPDPANPAAAPSEQAEQPHGLNVTNLHTHGLHITPADPGDNILLCLGPQEDHEFTFHIPSDHPAGTFWYHPHNHGGVAYQLSNGVSGALIVEGSKNDGIHDLDDIPEIAAAAEQIVVFELYNFRARNDPMHTDQPGPNAVGWIDASTIYNVRLDSTRCGDIKVPAADQGDDASTIQYQVTAINGQINPTFTFKPGELQRWRIIHAGWDQYRKLTIVDDATGNPVDDFSFMLIAVDGLAIGKSDKLSFKSDTFDVARVSGVMS